MIDSTKAFDVALVFLKGAIQRDDPERVFYWCDMCATYSHQPDFNIHNITMLDENEIDKLFDFINTILMVNTKFIPNNNEKREEQ